jgi:hypothetical protein
MQSAAEAAGALPDAGRQVGRFRVLDRIGEPGLTMVPAVRPAIDRERHPEGYGHPGDRVIQPSVGRRMIVDDLVLERAVPGEEPGTGRDRHEQRQARPAQGKEDEASID